MIKVIQIIADSSLSGGPTHVLGILKNIDKKKFECFLICPKGNLSTEAKSLLGVTVINVPMRSKFDLTSALEIKNEISKIQTTGDPFAKTIVHVHGIRAGLLARLMVPRGVKIIYTEHRFDADYRLKNPLNVWIQKKGLAYFNKRSNLVIAVSSSVENFLLKKKIAGKNQLLLIPNAINISSTVKSAPSGVTIGTIGSLNRQKGQKYLIQAMPKVLEKMPEAKLQIIGEGEERANLEELIRKLHLQNSVSLLGQKKDVEKIMSSWKLFVLPSVAETFGIAILQAMNVGVPVVATKVGGIGDIIANNKNGILVESKRADRLAVAIIKVLSSHELSNKLATEASKELVRFDWSRVIKQIENVYEKI